MESSAGAGAAPLNKIERAHQMYREGRHQQALGFYTEALAVAKSKAQKIALHSNRAACFLKLHSFKQAAEECSSVLELDQKHTGALMLRAQTLVTLKEYHSALFDVNRLLELNPSSEVYQDLQTRLKTQLTLAPIPECEAELEKDGEDEEDDMVEPKGEEEEIICGEGAEEAYEKKEVANGVAERDQKATAFQQLRIEDSSSQQQSKGWQAIPKPKGHSNLDYSRWDRVEDDSSEEEDDDDEDSQPKCRFRVRRVGIRPVK